MRGDRTQGSNQSPEQACIVISSVDSHRSASITLNCVFRTTSGANRIWLVPDRASLDEIVTLARLWQRRGKAVDVLASGCAEANPVEAWNEIWRNCMCPGVVFLRSGVRLTPGWLKLMHGTAYSSPRISSVGVLSNQIGQNANESWSIPHLVSMVDAGKSLKDMCLGPLPAPRIPGWPCILLNSYSLQLMSGLDHEVFHEIEPAVEEFLGRISNSGLEHVIEPRVFGADMANTAPSMLQVPSDSAIPQESDSESIGNISMNLAHSLWQMAADRNHLIDACSDQSGHSLLYVIFKGTGGTIHTNNDLMQEVSKDHPTYVLITESASWTLEKVRHGASNELLGNYELPDVFCPEHDTPLSHRQLFGQIIQALRVACVHFRHFLGSGPELVGIAKEHGCRTVVSVHDFYSLCPTIQMVDASGAFCGGDCFNSRAETTGCEDCTEYSYLSSVPLTHRLRNDFIHIWRKRFREALLGADYLITTCQTAVELVNRNLNLPATTAWRVIEHGREQANRTKPASEEPDTCKIIQLVLIGFINEPKGALLVPQIAQILSESTLRYHFHVVGEIAIQPHDLPQNFTVHGKYARAHLDSVLKAIQPSLCLVPSIWPETYCHVLTEALMNRIPVIVSNMGALQERVQRHGGGWLADPQSPQSWAIAINQACSNIDDYRKKAAEVDRYMAVPLEKMADDYRVIYRELLA